MGKGANGGCVVAGWVSPAWVSVGSPPFRFPVVARRHYCFVLAGKTKPGVARMCRDRRARPGWGNGCCWVARLGLVPPGCRCLTFLSAVVPLLCLGARPLPTLPPTGPAVCQCRTFRFADWLDPGSLLPTCCFPFSRIRFAVPNPLTSNLVSCRGVGHGSQGSAELFEI